MPDTLVERLRTAQKEVERLCKDATALHNTMEISRLSGKLEGIKLAISYLTERG